MKSIAQGEINIGQRVWHLPAPPFQPLCSLRREIVPLRVSADGNGKTETRAPLIDSQAWSVLEQVLRDLAAQPDGRLIYVPNFGNAGDALIASAAWQLFDDLDLHPLCLPISEVCPADRVIFAGGGVLVPQYAAGERMLAEFGRRAMSRLVILPHTIRGYPELLGQLGPRCTIFCRELISYEEIRATATHCPVHFGPDLALRLDVEKLRRKLSSQSFYGRLADAVSPLYSSSARRYRRWRRKLRKVRVDSSGTLRVYRTDSERTEVEPAAGDSWDISNFYGSDYRERLDSDRVSRDLLAVLDTAERVETNRLHVGIGAALLGKEVVLHDNSYGKIRAIYDASLRDWPNVRFAD